MSARIRPAIRSLLSHRTIHTSTPLLNDAPAPRSAADLGFGTANANRTRSLPKIDIPQATGSIDMSGSSRQRTSRDDRPNREPRQYQSRPRAPREQASQAKQKPSSSESEFFEGSDMARMPERAARATSENTGSSRRRSTPSIPEDLTSPGEQNPTGPPRSRQANREAALSRFSKGKRSGAPGTGGMGGPRSSAAGSYTARAGRSDGAGAGPRVGGWGARTGAGRTGGAGGAGPQGGRKRRPRERTQRYGDDGIRKALVREMWEGAPIPAAQPVDTSFTALFGKTPLVNAFDSLKTGKNESWTEGLSSSEILRAKTLRKAGDYSTVLPSEPFPLDASKGKNALSVFEWQSSLNPSIPTAKYSQALKEAEAYIQKAVS